ncbi:MAG: Holliday junction branch migration protein RuvA [Candidatus Margulisiibacteriota bacterium]|jgi:Holliday junction DNA helicase RuvA
MIAHVAGILDSTQNNQLVIDVNGVGYEVLVSSNVLSNMPPKGEFIKVFTYQMVREDDLKLFGFFSLEEKEIFTSLLSVSGIGGKTALSIISAIDKNRLINALVTGDITTLTSLPGIGKKTAERLVVELKDKLGAGSTVNLTQMATSQNTQDAISALQKLGYNSREISKALTSIEAEIKTESKIEDIIKLALKYL